MDRGNVDVYDEGGRGVRISWALSGLRDSPHVMDADQFPWTAKQLGHGDGRLADAVGVIVPSAR